MTTHDTKPGTTHGPGRRARVSFFPKSAGSLAQFWITTEVIRTAEEQPVEARWTALFDYLQKHDTFPRYYWQDFPKGCWKLYIVVAMEEDYWPTLRTYVSWLNRKYRDCPPLTVERLTRDSPPLWGFSSSSPQRPHRL